MRTKTSKQENMNSILESAVRCFREIGVQNAREIDVAAYAGVTPRCVRQHFGGMNNLIVAAVSHFLQSQISAMHEYYESCGLVNKTGYEVLKAYLDMEIERFSESYDNSMFLREIEVFLNRRPPEAKRKLKNGIKVDVVKEVKAFFGAIYERGMRDGSIRSDLKADLFMGALMLSMWGGEEKAAATIYLTSNMDGGEQLAQRIAEFEVYCDMILCYVRPQGAVKLNQAT